MKLYVGARRRVFVAQAGAADYLLCAEGAAGDSTPVAFAILADHLGDRDRALASRGHIERAFGARLRAPFWTLTEKELVDALKQAGDAAG